MIKFRIKNYTIPEGHYTGPKDMEDIPGAAELAAKGTFAGAGIGGLVGGISRDGHIISDAITGAKAGFLSGIAAKFFVNYLHKPMNHVKYQEVDKAIRRQFGVYQVSGITVGDSIDRRANISEKFEFNDRDVSKYKINIAIHDNTVTLYTFGLTKDEFNKVDKTLDYYCKKYFSMEYSSKVINARALAYAVDITFTNYQVICNFIMELSSTLGTRINLLDNNAIISRRLEDASTNFQYPNQENLAGGDGSDQEKTFSFNVGGLGRLNKYDIIKIISNGIGSLVGGFGFGGGPKEAISESVIEMLNSGVSKLRNDEAIKAGLPARAQDFNNEFLKSRLGNLHYIEGFNYTIGDTKCPINISLVSGVFMVSVVSGSKEEEKVEKSFKGLIGGKVKKSTIGKATVYTYCIQNRNEFDFVLKKLMSSGEKPNIFEK
jgi:hypothetical protein